MIDRMASDPRHTTTFHDGDTRVGNRRIRVRTGVAALRSVRLGVMGLAYELALDRNLKGALVLADTSITRKRLQSEWQQARSVLRQDVAERLDLYVIERGNIIGLQREPDAKTRAAILASVSSEPVAVRQRSSRPDVSFVVTKTLMLHWLTDGRPMTVSWLCKVTGFSYPSVAHVVKDLGSLIERRSDRRFRLRWFPKDELTRLLSLAPRARRTVRFADRSGQPRTIDAHIHRLERLSPRGVALGGVLGARHYHPDLDISGAPRLDLSVHSPHARPDLGFIEKLDPALKRVTDPQEPATVAVHILSQAEPFFAPRQGGLAWADPLECLIDLAEAGLQKQASEFLAALTRAKQEKS